MKPNPKEDPRAIREPELPQIVAIKAIAAGTADAEQQQRFIRWLIDEACGYHDRMAYFGPNVQEKTFFALGRRRVAEIVKMYIDLPIQTFKSDGQPSEKVS